MKSRILFRLLLCGILWSLAGCTYDEIDDEIAPPGDGECRVSLSTTFYPTATAELGRTRSSAGNAIGAIDDLFIVWYDADGHLCGNRYFTHEELKISDIDRGSVSDTPTQRAEFSCNIPYGSYRIYAAANMGDLSADAAYKDALDDEKKFRAISLTWEPDDIPANNQMSGYFSTSTSPSKAKGEAELIRIDRARQTLHAWIRRAASKVTISFDTKELYENTYIYIKSVHIHNVPRTCALLEPNDSTRIERAEHLYENSDTLYFSHSDDFNQWPQLTKGDNPLDGTDPKLHANDAQSLFFYENMQGKGWKKTHDKRQDADGDQKIDYPDGNDPTNEDYRDGKPCGTYIEVEGYYISNSLTNPGKGPIRYRFMLGKNTVDDYNAERNFHYKLTLRFLGNANDVDWHIVYNEEDGIYAPNPYFISYLYDHSMMLPVKIKGKITGGKIKARIVQNNWQPDSVKKGEFTYWDKEVYTISGNPTYSGWTPADAKLDNPKIKDGPWNGFLSLVKTSKKVIGDAKRYWNGYNYFYWFQDRTDLIKNYPGGVASYTSDKNKILTIADEKGPHRGEREYYLDPSTDPNLGNGNYTTRVDADNNVTVFNIPCYTRAMNLVPTTGLTGNNPYFSYTRSAYVEITANIDGREVKDTVRIIQVRRMINPKGIYRRHDNDAPFHVKLLRRMSESSPKFSSNPSQGPWRATVEKGGDWIKLNGVVNGVVNGSTGSDIEFTYQPNGTIDKDKCRYGIIKIEYHNYSCIHRIFVRQGYAPDNIVPNGCRWHCFNLRYQNKEGESPLEEGSLFRYGNIGQPIDAINNKFDNFADNSKTEFKLAPVYVDHKTGAITASGTATWDKITSESRDGAGFSTQLQTIDGKTCHVAESKDFEALRNQCQSAFGILYGDRATTTMDDVTEAYNFAYYHPDTLGRGMRGCFAYDPDTGKNIFFPVGVAGYGRRKDGINEGGYKAVLRYANQAALFTEPIVKYRPQLYDICNNYGAIYWVQQKSGDNVSWDINVSTYDFNTFAGNAFLGDTGSDAAFIRLVEDY